MTAALDLLVEYDACLGVTSPVPSIPAPEGLLSAHLPASGLALGSVAAVESAANRLRESWDLGTQPVALDPSRVAASISGDRMLRVDGEPVDGFAELSGFFGTSDGWVRTHANYPHHRSRLLAALGLPDDTARDDFAAHLSSREAQEVEDLAAATGAIAVRVREEREWAGSEPGTALRGIPLVDVRRRDAAPTVPWRPDGPRAERPLAGVRVLDLTRVIAGPVATRTLALLGAEVLRIDPVHMDEIVSQHVDTGQGKRTTRLDLRDPAGAATFEGLLEGADVLVTGYRPGSLESLGIDAAAQRPGLVKARVSAWGPAGPWAGRRGFDSIVQAASGIAFVEGDDRPGALPAQVLDHASGYLLAAAVVDALNERLADGRGRDVAVSLARTAAWLLASPHRQSHPAYPAQLPDPATTTVAHGRAVTARPALAGYADYTAPARDWGADAPRWG